MQTVGFLKSIKPGVLEGRIRTLEIQVAIRLETAKKRDPESPDFTVYAVVAGELVAIGGAWTKKITRGANEGQPFHSITLDDPSFAAPLNVAAFLEDGSTTDFRITWSRPRQQVAA